MSFTNTVDVLIDDTSTRMGFVGPPPPTRIPFARVGVGNSGDDRSYGRFCQDTMKSGHKDTKNTRLTIPLKIAHTLRHANINCRNPGDATRSMGDKAYVNRKVARVARDMYGGDAILGDEFKEVVTRLDPEAPLNGVTIDEFQHGGTRADAVRPTMMGAGATVPVQSMDGSELNNAYGLHYAIDIGPGNALKSMQQRGAMQGQNFMGR